METKMDIGGTTFALKNVATGYHLRHRDKILSRSLTACLKAGELTCLLGSNGVGKSTLLRTMARFQSPMSGELTIFGRPLEEYSAGELARVVGVVLTDKIPMAGMRAVELVAMGRLPYTGFWGGLSSEDRRIVDEAIDRVGMAPFKNRRLGTLSDGELQKLMIAKVLAQQTSVILLDEPIAFLDFPSKVAILCLLRRLAREENKAILLSIHDLELALQIADSLWLLDEGELHEGTPAELAEGGWLDSFFAASGLYFDRKHLQYTLQRDEVDARGVFSNQSSAQNRMK